MTDEIYCRSDEHQPRSKGERGASSAMLRNAGVRQAIARDTETGVSQGKWSEVKWSGVMRCRHEVSRESCLPTLITIAGSGSADNIRILETYQHWSSLGKVHGLICSREKNSHHHNVLRTTDFIHKSFVLNARKVNQLLLNLMTFSFNLLDIIIIKCIQKYIFYPNLLK